MGGPELSVVVGSAVEMRRLKSQKRKARLTQNLRIGALELWLTTHQVLV